MSDECSLELPFPHRRNPHQSHATQHHQEWLHRHRELAASTGELAYARWEVPELAALTYPESSPEDLDLAADLMGFYFLFDDQFDEALGREPERVAVICERLTAIIHSTRPLGSTPTERAFADLWRRSLQGMSARWRARAAYNWEWYFACHPAEAAGRISSRLPDREGYLMLRRGTAAMETIFDMVERLGRFEVPQAVLHHPVLRQLRQLAADIPSLSNDVRSYAQELARGDVANLVMIVQRERGCPADEAASVVMAEAQLMVHRFAELMGQLPEIYSLLGLTTTERHSAHRYADGLAAWTAGYLRWEARTGRYLAG